MARPLAALAAAAAASLAGATPSWFTGDALMSGLGEAWKGAHKDVGQAEPRRTLGAFLERLDTTLRRLWDSVPADQQALAQARATLPLAAGPTPYPNPLPGPYWRWVPEVVAEVPPGTSTTFTSPCFASTTASTSYAGSGNLNLTLTAASPTSGNCSDTYLLATVEWLNLVSFTNKNGVTQSQSVQFPVSNVAGASNWVARNGARVMRFLDPEPLTLLWEAIATISLFVPALTSTPVDPASAQRNYDFLQGYANISMPVRPIVNVTVDPSLIQSGDLCVIHRPDGLGTLEQWGTGAPTTHVTTFMRTEATNELVVCESQSSGADWAIDKIQCNPWDAWQAMAYRAGYGWVWMPLTAEARANWNNTAAWAFLNATLGVNYGFQEFAVTFFDTVYQNLPWPCRWEHLEVVVPILEGLLDPFLAIENTPLINLLFTQSMVQRLGSSNWDMPFTQALDMFAARNMSFGQALAIPEQDTWLYPQRTGVAPGPGNTSIVRVCNAYACAIHKAAGLFGELADQINCAETHNTDVESMPQLDPAPVRPQACIDADPDYAYCQLAGERRIPLPTWRTQLYAHMDETCPGLPTTYSRPAGC